MKKLLILILSLLLFSTGCEKKEERVLNVLNWSSYIPTSVIQDFEKEYGIKVNYGTYSSNEECLAKVQAASPGTYDLIFPSDYMIQLMIERNIIQKLDVSRLENYSNINPNYLQLEYDPKNEYSIPFLAASSLIVYDPTVIKEKITSYRDLENPDYKGKIVLLDDYRIVIGMALQRLGYDMNDANEEHLMEAKNWLLQIKDNIKAFDSDSPKSFIISKEASIGVIWNAEAALALNENPLLKVVYPTDGFAISIDHFALVDEAQNVNEAYLFIDYILRSDVMAKIIEAFPYKNVNRGTDQLLSSSYFNNPAANIDDSLFKQGSFVQNIGSSIDLYDKVWAMIK